MKSVVFVIEDQVADIHAVRALAFDDLVRLGLGYPGIPGRPR
jgi:hypothetical protein